jgi:hypothetical protein
LEDINLGKKVAEESKKSNPTDKTTDFQNWDGIYRMGRMGTDIP